MQFQGLVTRHEPEYCIFTLDTQYTVYAGHLFANTNKITLPALGDSVTLTNIQVDGKNIFLNTDSAILCAKYCSIDLIERCVPFMELIKNQNLNFVDSIAVIRKVYLLNKQMSFPPGFLARNNLIPTVTNRQIVFEAIPFLNIKFNNKTVDELLSTLKIITPKNLRLESEAKPVKSTSYYSYGVHYFPNTECLIAFLSVSLLEGFMILSDNKFHLPCVVARGNQPNYTLKLSKVLNNLVLVQNYYIFTDNTQGCPTRRHIFVNIDDIHPMNWNLKLENKITNGVRVKMTVLHRATVTLTRENKLNCWIICQICDLNSNQIKKCCLKLFGKHLERYPLFNNDDEYYMTLNSAVFIKQMTLFVGERTYQMDGESLPVFSVAENTTFEYIPSEKSEIADQIANEFSLMTVDDVCDALKCVQTQKLFSFEGVIDKKNFFRPFDQKISPSKHPAFGIPGPQIHQITMKKSVSVKTRQQHLDLDRLVTTLRIYASDEGCEPEQASQEEEEAELDVRVFMHNWETLQVPLGLIPGMRIAVRKVLIAKNYFKPTFMTRIELVGYEPPERFETCFELTNNVDWGPKISLGNSAHIPSGCLCWGSVITIKITTLNISYECPVCQTLFSPNDDSETKCCLLSNPQPSNPQPSNPQPSNPQPSNPQPSNPKRNLLFVLSVRDSGGMCDVIGKDDDVLRELLGLRRDEWKVWLRCFWAIKRFTLQTNDDDEPMFQYNSSQTNFSQTVKTIVTLYNRQQMHGFDLKCRKLSKKEDDIYDKWFVIEARTTIPKDNIFIWT